MLSSYYALKASPPKIASKSVTPVKSGNVLVSTADLGAVGGIGAGSPL